MKLRERLIEVVKLIEDVSPGHENLGIARNLIADAGILPGELTGRDLAGTGKRPEDFTEDEVYAWILGQFANVIDCEAWYVMNSGINIAIHWLEHYAPEEQ